MEDCAAIYECLTGINHWSMEEEDTCASQTGHDLANAAAFLQQIDQCRSALCVEECPA
jgi:hypothetical protein